MIGFFQKQKNSSNRKKTSLFRLLLHSMEHLNIFVGIGIIIFISVLLLGFVKIQTQKKRAQKFQQKIQKFLAKIKKMPESHNNQKILEYDKILDMCLYEKISGTKNLTTGGKMKKLGKSKQKFQNENKIWSAHRLRNKIAHEVGFIVSTKNFREAEKSFIQEISGLLHF